MGKTREIKGRIRAVGNIQRITKTMQMIATARFQAALKRVTASKPYTNKIGELVGELAGSLAGGEISHPLLAKSDPNQHQGRQLLLVINSNRGLCGSYNAGVLRLAVAHLRQGGDKVDLELVGKKGAAFFKFAGRAVSAFHGQFSDTPDYREVEKLAQKYMDAYKSGKYESIRVCYMSFRSVARQAPVINQLLPLEDPTKGQGQAAGKAGPSVEYDFSPDPQQLLTELLPQSVKAQLYQWFNEAALGEQIARMVAMKAATDAAGKMRKALTRRFNRVRQAAITTELTEIIGGTAALS